MTFPQTATPLYQFYSYLTQWKAALAKDMVGKKLNEIRTPSLIIDRTVVEQNCIQLSKITTDLDTKVRIHVKTHKTVEGARIQLEGAKSDAIVVSTMAEAYAMVDSELTESGLLQDVLLGFPITPDKFDDVVKLSKRVNTFQIFIDDLVTLQALESYCKENNDLRKFNVLLKVDCGYGRAGVPLNDPHSLDLATKLQDSPHVNFVGIYTHAGHSYNSKTSQEAYDYLQNECNIAREFREYFENNGVKINYVSIGATPTVKAILQFSQQSEMKQVLKGIDEVHAGAFAFLDRQQVSTGLGGYKDVAISVACRIASIYSDRDSLLIDGGALAFSKDVAPQGGFGYVLDPSGAQDENGQPKIIASLDKVSQEHGILHVDEKSISRPELQVGQLVRVIPNHCCLTSACHLYYLIIENGSDTVVDVWVPVKGW